MGDSETSEQIDLEEHARNAVAAYLPLRPFYADLSTAVSRILEECLKRHRIGVHSVQSRAKDPESFGRKASTPSEHNPDRPKYPEPLEEITDLSAVRIITYFNDDVDKIDTLIGDEFDVIERSDKGKALIEEDKFGYQSLHFLVNIRSERVALAEYARFSGVTVEVQVRTILQHAWAEIEHDIQYKSPGSIPSEIRRRFMALSGMLEVADREFQAIHDADKKLAENTKKAVQSGRLSQVEITPTALKAFLDKRMGPDGRMKSWSYEWTSRTLRTMGFKDLERLEAAISPYDDGNKLSMIAYGTRQGQLTRFELMLLAACGERYIQHHPWFSDDWFVKRERRHLAAFKKAGVQLGGAVAEATQL